MPNYKGKPNCTRGHKPWPYGVCLKCAPPIANIQLQKYRHVDGISIPSLAIQYFYSKYGLNNPKVHAGIMFGTYINEDQKSNNPDGIRAICQSIYVPPQKLDNHGRFVFQKDPNENIIHNIANLCGLEVIGWLVCTQPRSGKKIWW